MKAKDSTEKDVKTPSDARIDPASDAAKKPSEVGKELTDAECAAVTGGIQGAHIGTNVA